jgi:hypothetical protein
VAVCFLPPTPPPSPPPPPPPTAARVGGTLELAVDPARFHFFDPETGERLEAAAAPQLVGAR